MEEKRYRNYIFDLYGTLVDIHTNENKPYLWKKMSELYQAFGVEYTPKELKDALRRLEREALKERNTSYAEVDFTALFGSLYERKGIKVSEELCKFTAMTFRILSRNNLCLYEGILEMLETLKKQGQGIYLLSNAQSDFTRPELLSLGLLPYFDGIFISSELGEKKPSPVFFQRLLETYHLNPEECLMIGNDAEADIEGARAAGLDSLYFHTNLSFAKYEKGRATFEVLDGDTKKLRELLLKHGIGGKNDKM